MLCLADAEDGLTIMENDFSSNVEDGDSHQSLEGNADDIGDPPPPSARDFVRPLQGGSTDPCDIRFLANMTIVTHAQLLQLLGHADLQRLFTNHDTARAGSFGPDDDADVDLDDGYGGFGALRRPRLKGAKTKPPPVPSEEGRELMNSGLFGTSTHYQNPPGVKAQLARSLLSRELGIDRTNPVTTNKLLSHVYSGPGFFLSTTALANATPDSHTILSCRHDNPL